MSETSTQWAAGEAARIHAGSLVWDMVFPIEPWCGNGWDKLGRFHETGYDVISVTLAGDNHSISEAVQRVAAARREVLGRPDELVLVESVNDVHKARKEGRLGVAFHFEGTRCFERNLDMIEAFYQLGIRHTLLAFNQGNSVGGGCAERSDGGLTNFGRLLVEEMERVGMLLDLSHTGRKTAMDALEMATHPAVFTHSNADAVASHFRNLPDDLAKACAATGGLVGVSSSNEYLGVERSSPEAIFRHVDHYVQLLGPEHVGLGFDVVFDAKALSDWIRTRPDEWPGKDDPTWPGFTYGLPEDGLRLTELMVVNGYDEKAIRKILGKNYMRVCEEVWN
ncbi:MAG: membrane dipeptidase [Xanthomonadales bacterium]|nr:membrane dipeptidase [Xanthomonadales bacterium]